MVAPGLAFPAAPARPLRLACLFGVVCLCAAAIAGRLAYWQVVRAAPLQRTLTLQRALDEQVPARRGRIRDANGDLLAGNVSVDYVYAVPRQIKNPDEVAARLAPVLEAPAAALLPLLADQDRQYVRLIGGRKVPPEVSEQIAKLRLPGVFLEPATKRTYPERELAGSATGNGCRRRTAWTWCSPSTGPSSTSSSGSWTGQSCSTAPPAARRS
jgi:cell division protein FtsI/penicillin-binding protein 2